MKSNFQKIIKDKDVEHLSIGWSSKNGYSILIRMYDDQVANCIWCETMEDVEKWLKEEVGVVKKPAPVKPSIPMPPPLPLPTL